MPSRTLHISSDYDRARARHVFQRDSFLGGEHYRCPTRTTLSTTTAWTYALNAQGTAPQALTRTAKLYTSYLVSHAAESDESFEERLARACYLNLVAPIVSAYAEGVTARVDRDIPDSYGDLSDVDGRGGAWAEHVEEVAQWAALYGYVAVVYDAPAANPAATRADELAAGIGPRVVVVQPLAIAWVEVDDGGKLVTFAYVEQATADETSGAGTGATGALWTDVTVRVWTLAGGDDGATPEWQVRKGRINAGASMVGARTSLALVERGPLPAVLGGELPVVFAFYKRDTSSRFPMGQSVCDDACDIARSIYNKLSEEDELHTKAGFPFLAIPKGQGAGLDPETRLALGPGRGLAYDAGAGAPQWVQPSAESSQELRASIVFRAAMAFRLAGIEVATDQSGQAESGIALRVRARGYEARAARFAQAMARYETAGLKLWKLLAGASEDASVAYPKRFTLPDSTEDLAAALQLLTQSPVELGVKAKVALVRKALDAVLAIPDEDLSEMVDEVAALLEQDMAEADAAQQQRMTAFAPKPPPAGGMPMDMTDADAAEAAGNAAPGADGADAPA
ncbi:MAG TPA: hypothetical protein VIU16_02605, partial [Gaiellaceae bacterium]